MRRPHDTLLLEEEVMRDGLQIESRILSLPEKIELFGLLARAGMRRIQVGSFVHPSRVPQMADTDALIAALAAADREKMTALVLNGRGLERALASGIPHVSMSVSISDSHSRKNANISAAEALSAMLALIGEAIASGLKVRAGLQSSFGCVYEGMISEDAVLAAAGKMAAVGVNEINLADSSGMASPASVRSLVRRLAEELPEAELSLHLHDTRGMGMVNMFAGYEEGVRIFDVCAGGLGGCPFIKGAAGNVPSEDAVHMFASQGIETGVDLPALVEAVRYLESVLGRDMPGKMRRVLDYGSECRP